MLELWSDMAKEGNWVPSWPDSLAGLTAEEAAGSPGDGAHSVWQEVVHVCFWREVTLRRMAGGPNPDDEEIEREEFAKPESLDEASWSATVARCKKTHEDITAAIQNPNVDCSRVPYHILHDAYHLGRITLLRSMRGVAPKF